MGIAWFDKLRKMMSGNPQGAAVEEALRLRSQVVRFYSESRLAEATEVAQRLADCQRRLLGGEHPDYAQGLSNLALLYQRQGDDQQAAELVERVLAIRRVSLGENHSKTVGAEVFLNALRGTIEDLSPKCEPIPASRLYHPCALAVLDRVLELRYIGRGKLVAFSDCQAAARVLRSEIEKDLRADAAGQLAEGEHPFAALLALAGPPKTLSDALWADLYEAVQQAFGGTLAMAASRGHIR